MVSILATALVVLLLRRPMALENGFQEDTRFLQGDEDAVLLATPSRFVSISAEVDASGTATSRAVGGSVELESQPGTEGSGAAVLGVEGSLSFMLASSALERLGSSSTGASAQQGAGGANDTFSAADAQHGSNRTVNAADALQDALQHIEDARGAYMSYHVDESKTGKSWWQDDVPNPLRNPSGCGQKESSWICDPEGLLGQPEGLLVANTTSNASEQGEDIGKLHSLVNKLQELPAPSRCEHFRLAILLVSALELGASQEAMGTFAEAMLERWNVSSSACGVLLLMSCADHGVFLATQVGVRGLLPHKVASRIVRSMQEDMIHGQYLEAALMATTEVSAMLATWKPEPPRIAVARAAEAKALGIAGNILLCFSAGVALFCCLFWKACQQMPH